MAERLTDGQVNKLIRVVDPELNRKIKNEQIAHAIGRLKLEYDLPKEVLDFMDASGDIAAVTGIKIGLKAAMGDEEALKSIARMSDIPDFELGKMIGDRNG